MSIFKKLMLATVFMALAGFFADAKDYSVQSPDGRLQATVNTDGQMTLRIAHNGTEILSPSPISIERTDGIVWGKDAKVQKAVKTSVNTTVNAVFYRSSEIVDNYNSLTLKMKGLWSLELRAYNDGIAYRFVNNGKTPFEIRDEVAEYRFPKDAATIIPYVAVGDDGDFNSQYHSSFENVYTVAKLSEFNPERLAFLPLAVEAGDVKLCFTEVNLRDYPGMYLINRDGGNHLEADFAQYPKNTFQGGHNNLQIRVSEREDYIAKVEEARAFPWRAVIIGNDVEIASSDMTYLLADESKIADTSWIRPGKVAWDWWNDWNITGVDFKSGINNDTYKYYIDFASENGIEYVILDEGWAVNLQADLFQVIPEIDLEMLADYAESKGVGLILWAGYWAFDRDMEKVCRHYSEMGIKGFKVDFMDRDDQFMTEFYYRGAEVAAKYNLILDYHGAHMPAGINRTWPNVLNFEGVHGLENMKWRTSECNQVEYDAMIPFLRQVAGPMDYTQGAMINKRRDNYYPSNSEPMSQGTRCHQLALYMVLESPINMLCDSPTNYLREKESTDFIASIPTVWDDTRILAGEMGEYIITARCSGEKWYIGAITDWNPRDLEVDLSFLGKGNWELKAFADGINADKKATDYKVTASAVSKDSRIKVHLAPGGGWAAVIEPQKTAIVAHRGFWNCDEAGYAKNSLAALKCAQDAGFWGSECDVNMTADEVLVVYHDSEIDGKLIEKYPHSEFKDVRLSNGEPIPTFQQYCEQVAKCPETVLVCELKPHSCPEVEDRFLELAVEQLKANGIFDPEKVIFISFSWHLCQTIADKYPEFTNQYLEGDKAPAEVHAAGVNGIDYDHNTLSENHAWVYEAHNLGMSTNAWTPTEDKDQVRMLNQGIRYITTDKPLRARELFKELGIVEVVNR